MPTITQMSGIDKVEMLIGFARFVIRKNWERYGTQTYDPDLAYKASKFGLVREIPITINQSTHKSDNYICEFTDILKEEEENKDEHVS